MAAKPSIRKLTLSECGKAMNVAVVIDVLRAFSAEAFAFDCGVREIVAVGTVEEALEWKEQDPSVLLMGEVGGYPVTGFDLWNSPTDLLRKDLVGKRLVHRSSAGTQGIVCSAGCELILAASFVCAKATARYLRNLNAPHIDFVITGQGYGRDGDEDAACADYIAALLRDENVDPAPFRQRVFDSDTGRRFLNEKPEEIWREDLKLCTEIDRFDFTMRVWQENGSLVVRPVKNGA